MINSIYNSATTIFPLAASIPTALSLAEALQRAQADSAFLSPSTVEELSKDPYLLTTVSSKLSLLFWSGGDLPHRVGCLVASRMPLFSCYGSSEYGAWPLLRQAGPWPEEDWNYFKVHPILNAKFRYRGEGLFELVLPSNPGKKLYLSPFLHFPGLSVYPTRDLFTPHPSKSGFWRYAGRADDIIIFLNGEKTNPL